MKVFIQDKFHRSQNPNVFNVKSNSTNHRYVHPLDYLLKLQFHDYEIIMIELYLSITKHCDRYIFKW
jgi:hypothetical protein